VNSRSRAGSIFDESIYGATAFGMPVIKKSNVFTLDIPVAGFGALGKDAADWYNDAKRYIGRYDTMIMNIARIASSSARDEFAKAIGSAKEAGSRFLGIRLSSGSPAYYANEVRSYVMDAEKPPYSAANPNYLEFTKRRAPNRVAGLGDALKALEPKVDAAMKLHGVLSPDKSAEYEKNLNELRAQIEKLQAKEGGAGGTPAPATPAGNGKRETVMVTPGWVLPVVIGGLAVVGIGAYFLMQKK